MLHFFNCRSVKLYRYESLARTCLRNLSKSVLM
jgi:hypothetical protein